MGSFEEQRQPRGLLRQAGRGSPRPNGLGLDHWTRQGKTPHQAGPVSAAGAVLGAPCNTNSFSHSRGGSETRQESHRAKLKVLGGTFPLEALGTLVPPLTSMAANFLGLWPLPLPSERGKLPCFPSVSFCLRLPAAPL